MPLSCSCAGPLPGMHFPKQLGLDRNAWFMNYIYGHLQDAMPYPKIETRFIRYPIHDFINFIDQYVLNPPGISLFMIYFAAIDDKLDLIYATNDPANPGGQLFYIYTGGAFTPISKGSPSAPGTASYFVTQFINSKVPILRTVTGIQNPPLACSYKIDNIKDLIREIICQNPIGIKAYFSCYLPNDPKTQYRKMMFVDFVLTSTDAAGNEIDAYVDDCPNYPGRYIKTIVYIIEDILKKGVGLKDIDIDDILGILNYDNATMCPPNTCNSILP